MSLTLIFSWEIQINIRLFVSLKSEECLKRNIKSRLCEVFSTIRTLLVWHVTAGTTGKCSHLIRIKIIIVTFFTVIMRTQRINLCNTRHCSNKRRTYWASRTYQISILIGLPHQFLCNNIHNGKSVRYNRIQFLLQTFDYHIRQIFAIHLMRCVITNITQNLVWIFNHGRTLIRTNRKHIFHLICNHICICHYNLIRLITSEILKFL